jgi:hypothetical protein
MIDPSSKLGRELKAADDFFELAKNADSPFLRGYYRRVAERYPENVFTWLADRSILAVGDVPPPRNPNGDDDDEDDDEDDEEADNDEPTVVREPDE